MSDSEPTSMMNLPGITFPAVDLSPVVGRAPNAGARRAENDTRDQKTDFMLGSRDACA